MRAASILGIEVGEVATGRLYEVQGPVAPDALDSLVRRLLANAVRYTVRGGVLLGMRRVGAHVRVEVWDTGPGIKQAEVDRIFEEFYRGESSKAENSGTGFGLGLFGAGVRLGGLGRAAGGAVGQHQPGNDLLFEDRQHGLAAGVVAELGRDVGVVAALAAVAL